MKKVIFFLTAFYPIILFSQTVSSADDLNTARWAHESQLLNNGKVLVFGGDNCDGLNYQVFSSAEMYDPASNSWSMAASMSLERTDFSSVLLNDGNVLAIGGQDQNDLHASCELFNVSTNTWQSIPAMNTPRAHHASVKLMNGKVLVAGGYGGNGTELYDPYTNSWSIVGNMKLTHGRGMAMALLDDGRVLATGGADAPTRGEIFDPKTGQWTLLTAMMARNHYYHQMVRLNNGRFLIVGTQAFSTADQLSSELYNPGTQTFSVTGNLLTNVGVARMILMDDGRVLHYSLGDFFSPSNTKCIQVYNPSTGIWSASTYTIIGANVAAINKLHDGRILLAGGSFTTGNGADNTCYLVNQTAFPSCIPPATNLSVTGNTGCNGNSVTVNLGSSENSIIYEAWIGNIRTNNTYNGSGSSIIMTLPEDKLSPGRNIVKVKASKTGCPGYFLTDTAVVTISIPPTARPVITPNGPTVFCSGGNVQLTAPPGMIGYQWNNGATSQSITVASSGFYSVRVKDASGCFTDYSDLIEVSETPSIIDAGPSVSVCISEPAFALTGFSPAGGTWSGTGVSPEGIFDPSISGAGTFTLTYTLCGNSSNRSITVIPIPAAADYTLSAFIDTLCYNGSTTIRVMNPAPSHKYELWKNGTLINSQYYPGNYPLNFGTGQVQANTPFLFKAITTNSCGSDTLEKIYNIGMHVNPHLSVGAKTPFVCRQGSAMVYVANSQDNVFYQLRIGTQNIGASVRGNGDTLFLPTGTLFSSVTYSVSGRKGSCSVNLLQTASFTVSGPSAHFYINTCNPEVGEVVKITNTSINNTGGSFDWTFGTNASVVSSTSQNPADVIYSSVTGTRIKLVCTDQDGCIDSISRTINVINPITGTSSCNYSLASAPSGTVPLGVAYDDEGNSFLFTDCPVDHYNFSHRGDTLKLVFDNLSGYNKKKVLVKYNSKGTIMWATYLRNNSTWQDLGDIITDSLGNVYIAYYHGDYLDDVRAYSTDGKYVTFDPPHSGSSQESMVILKYDKHGILQWYNTYLDYYTGPKVSLAVDKNLNLYAGSSRKFVKFDVNGQKKWERGANFTDIEIDNLGYIWGVREWNLILDKFDSTGTLLYSTPFIQTLGTSTTDHNAWYLNIDKQNNLYIAGDFRGSFKFNKDTLTDIYTGGSGHRDIFICKFNYNGGQEWIRQIKVDKGSYLKGMDLKDDTIVFMVASNAKLKYNLNLDKTWNDSLLFSGLGFLIGVTDTSESGNIRLRKITDNGTWGTIPSYQYVSFARSNKKLILTLPFHDNQAILGENMQTLFLAPYQLNTIVMRGDLSCLFRPLPPSSMYTLAGSKCAGEQMQFFDMSTEEPTSWSWSFPGGTPSSSNLPNPQVSYSSGGTYTVTLTASNEEGTGNSYSTDIIVNTNPTVSVFQSPSKACRGANVTLYASGANTYKWSNNATGSSLSVTNVQKDSSITVTGTTTSTGCKTVYNHFITMYEKPAVDFTTLLNSGYCKTDPPVSLQGTPSGGYFSGGGISGSTFNPASAPTGTINICYAYYDANGCSNSDCQTITVGTGVTVSMSPINPVCSNASPITLTGGLPAGGTYSGTGISAGVFYPSVSGSGNFPVTYSYSANGCTGTASTNIIVNSVPTVSFSPLNPICSNSPSVILIGGAPAGGTYSGVGVSGGNFYPSLSGSGNFPITYSYTSGGCTGSASSSILVNAAPMVSMTSLSPVCTNAAPVTLMGGSPVGGTYSGIGVSGTTFDPTISGQGIIPITYSYTSSNGCTGTASATINVDICAGLNNFVYSAVKIYPNPCSNQFIIETGNITDEPCELSMYNNEGKVVFRQYTRTGSLSNRAIDISLLNSGMYYVKVLTESGLMLTDILIKAK